MMHCERAREALWPMDGPGTADPDDPDVEEARAHLEGCSECRAFFLRDAALDRALQRADIASPAPSVLRERAAAAIAGAQSPFSRPAGRAVRWLAAAAALVLAAVGLSRLGLGVSRAEAAYISDYRSHLTETAPTGGPDLMRTYELFERELGVRLPPVIATDGEAVRAMVCLIDGRRVATVEYQMDGHKVAHYRVPTGSEAPDPGALRSDTNGDLSVVRWLEGAIEHALVSDLDPDRLRRIAIERFSAPD